MSLIYCMTSSTVHRFASWLLGLGLSLKLPDPGPTNQTKQKKNLSETHIINAIQKHIHAREKHFLSFKDFNICKGK